MKKFIAIIVAIAAFASVASAQSKAFGVRAGYGGELSYQHYVGGANFAEFDLGFFGHNALFTGIYNFNIAGDGNVNFYAGPGAQVGMYFYENTSGLDVAVAGMMGIEYNFRIPLNISLDWRPAFHFLGDNAKGFYYDGIALGLRYKF